MLGVVTRLTGGAISKVVAESSATAKELPVTKPGNALDEFNAEYGNVIDTAETLSAFDVHWQALQSSITKDDKPQKKLVSVLWRTFWKDILKAAFLKAMWGSFVIFSVAFFVFRLLAYIKLKANDTDHTHEERVEAYFLVPFFFVSITILSIALQQMNFVSYTLGLKVKAALVSAIYRKMLVREGYQSDADVVSLVAKDCPKIAEACTSLQFLWSGVFEALGIFAILISYIGVAALPGVGWLFVALPLQYGLGMWLATKKYTLAKDSKKRIKLMEEILRGIKLIKTYGWEAYFKKIIEDYRVNEAKSLDFIHVIKSLILANVFACPPLFCILIFGTYESVSAFDATISFTTLTFFNTLRLPLVKLPKGLRDVLDARLALDRIESFLLEKELDGVAAQPAKTNSNITSGAASKPVDAKPDMFSLTIPSAQDDLYTAGRDQPSSSGVHIKGAAFSYGATAEPLLLDINLSLPGGSLLMVAGPVASGKTNLLRAVLGQMSLKSGNRSVEGSLAYVPQVPWTALGTVRDNILFGLPWDEAHYRHVIWACALETDLKLMSAGDQTYIGERGGNLSGGQKQRIALARAAYSRADVNVLDSPLSAVDMHTCQHIFRHCIQDMMLASGGTVVLATHQTELFPHATSLAVMAGGRIAYSGGYDFASIHKYFPLAADLTESAQKKYVPGSGKGAPGEGPAKDLMLGNAEAQTPTPSAAPASTTPPAAAATARRDPYSVYVSGWIGLGLFLFAQFVMAFAQGIRTYSDTWISSWTTRQYSVLGELQYITLYFMLVMLFVIGAFLRSYIYHSLGIKASRQGHDSAFNALMRAPLSYYITTPVGNLLAFFSKDLETIDDILVDSAAMFFIYFWILMSNLIVVSYNFPIFPAVVGFFFVVFIYVFRRYYIACARVKVVVGRSADEVVAHTSETLSGLAVVRAFGAQDRFRAGNMDLQDKSCAASLAQSWLSLWLAFRLDLVGVMLVMANTVLAVFSEGGDSAKAGLAMSNSFQILLFFSVMTQTMGDIHAATGAVDRAEDIAQVKPELDGQGEALSEEERALPAAWPDRGEITFSGVVMPYLPGTPPVLRGVDFSLRSGEKVGVVGRTGAGKSSLIIALYRLVESSSGTIHIDGVNVARLTLNGLRRRIAIIPQEPVMFSGTLRSNLDPFGLRSDSELIASLEACLLGPTFKALKNGLDSAVDFAGSNFSLGQQQLVCLARAMLCKSKLLLLDEATAALDSETDAAVQKVLRCHFAERTTMTIAHRLDTIIDSDRILVLDAGRVIEFASPSSLLSDESSSFSGLCKRTGPAQYRALCAAAHAAAKQGPFATISGQA